MTHTDREILSGRCEFCNVSMGCRARTYATQEITWTKSPSASTSPVAGIQARKTQLNTITAQSQLDIGN